MLKIDGVRREHEFNLQLMGRKLITFSLYIYSKRNIYFVRLQIVLWRGVFFQLNRMRVIRD